MDNFEKGLVIVAFFCLFVALVGQMRQIKELRDDVTTLKAYNEEVWRHFGELTNKFAVKEENVVLVKPNDTSRSQIQ